tara:strand:+ start:87 stop:476 length:390 start_codon:yes stop_codon:yes gene_type:complete
MLKKLTIDDRVSTFFVGMTYPFFIFTPNRVAQEKYCSQGEGSSALDENYFYYGNVDKWIRKEYTLGKYTGYALALTLTVESFAYASRGDPRMLNATVIAWAGAFLASAIYESCRGIIGEIKKFKGRDDD